MSEFLREYWPWILIPCLVVLAVIVVLALFLTGGEDSSFVYPVF